MNERARAITIATWVLDRPNADWRLIEGTLRERLEYAREQHTLAGGRLVPGEPATPEFHRACVVWYADMLLQLDAIEAEARADLLAQIEKLPALLRGKHNWNSAIVADLETEIAAIRSAAPVEPT